LVNQLREVRKMSDTFKPGEKPLNSAQYEERGPRGGKVNNLEITGIQNKPLPPTSKPGNVWMEKDRTVHKKR
jgi:hypothetical protein